MDIFRRKKKPSTSSSQEEPVRDAPEKPPRHKKRHSIGDIGLLFNNKKQNGHQNEVELPLSPHARAALPDRENAKDLPLRVSKRRAPGPPKMSPKRGAVVGERMSQSAMAKTTVCSTEVFHDSHIGHEVTSPASSVSGRFVLAIPGPHGQRKGSNSSSVTGSLFAPSPFGSIIQPLASPGGSVVHESAVFRSKPVPVETKDKSLQHDEPEMARSVPNHSTLDDEKPVLDSRKSRSNQDLPLVSECTAELYCDVDQISSKSRNEDKISTKFLGEPVVTWTSQNVVDWCRLKGFNDYAELFKDSDIDGGNLVEITENDLVELDFDLPSLRPFLAEIEHLRRVRGTMTSHLSAEDEVENIRIEYWSNENVLHWLSGSGLDRFIPQFKDARVTGVDLVKLDMEMLDRLGIVSNQDREDFLAKLYDTMSKQEEIADNNDDLSEHLAAEAERVVSATESARTETGSWGSSLASTRSKRAHPGASKGLRDILRMLDAQEYMNLLTSYDEAHIQQFKRACEDLSEEDLATLYDDLGTRLLFAEKELINMGDNETGKRRNGDYEDRLLHAETVVTLLEEQKISVVDAIQRRKVTSHLQQLPRSSLYDQLFTTSHEIIAVTIHHKSGDGCGFSVERQGVGGLVVTRAEDGLPLEIGDRLIELNAYNLSSARRDDVMKLISACDWPLRMVVLRPVDKEKECDNRNTSEEEALREDLMNVMKDLELAIEEKEDLERRNNRMVSMLRGLNNDKRRQQDQLAQLRDELDRNENEWGAICTMLDRLRPDKTRERSDHEAIVRDVADIIQQLQNKYKEEDVENRNFLEPVPYDTYDDSRPLWEQLRNENKGILLQALKDAVTETQLRRDLDNRLICYLLEEAPHILAKMIQKDQITYAEAREADSYLC